ncbi:MAG TPA: PilN domain-containing protein [Steroidobacteraceae bacterium]|nr:PilN domain-containing protein [Steroidobacteraceae bacterium]
MPRINLLPWREAERKRKRQEFGVGALAALILAAVIGFAFSWQMQSAIDDQNERNQLLKTEIQKLDKQIEEINGLDQQKQRLVARMEVIQQLQRSRPEAVHLMDQLVRTLPDGVYLTSVKQTDKKVQLKGIAQSSTRVSAYMRNIEGSEWLDDPSLEIVESKGSTDNGSEFVLYATQTTPGAPADGEETAKVAARGPAR